MSDFVFSYEHKAREMESIVLVKTELEKRGYSVALFGSYEKNVTKLFQAKYLNPKVVVVSALYNPDTLTYFSTQLFGLKRKVANLQWEQIFVSGYESQKGVQISGFVKNAVHFCWGDKERERLLSYGVPDNKAVTVGHLSMDYVRPEFKSFLMTRAELAKQFNLEEGKEWALFVSSFNVVNCDPLVIQDFVNSVGEEIATKYVNFSVESRKMMLEWFDLLLKNNPNKVLIYRPHPNEVVKDGDPMLNSLKEKYPNFRIIKDHAIKHWIANCDIVYNWTSTSMVDILQLNKNWHILRPCPVPGELDYPFMATMPSITSFDVFEESFKNKDFRSDEENAFKGGTLEEYYDNLKCGTPAYIKVADVLESMLKDDEYNLHFPVKYIISCFAQFTKRWILYYTFNHQKLFAIFSPILRHTWNAIAHEIDYLKKGVANNVITESEVKALQDKLRPIVDGEEL